MRRRMSVSRRDLVKSAAALAVAGLTPFSARAIARLAAAQAEVILVTDGHINLPLGYLVPDLAQDELSTLLGQSGMSTDAYKPDCNVTLVRSGDRLAIFDVGAGASFMP